MRKQHLQLLLLGFAPTLLVVLLSLVLLYRRPNLVDLIVAMIATFATFACNILLKRSLDAHLFGPLKSLARDFSRLEPGLPVASRTPMFEQLITALEHRMADLESRQQTRLGLLRDDNARLTGLVSELQDALASTKRSATLERDDRKFESRFAAAVASAATLPLSRIISNVNLLTAEDALEPRQAERLVSDAGALVFLARELKGFDYSDEKDSRFDIRQVTDEAIAAIAPVLPAGLERILPFYDRFGQKRFFGNAQIIKALLFNYLLANVLHADTASLDVHVSYLADGQLAFVLSPPVPLDAHLQHRRLAGLMSPLRAALNDGMLTIPVTADDTVVQPDTRLRAMIVSTDKHEQACLAARLESMRVEITSGHYDVDVCVATIDDVDETVALRDKLRDEARLLLLRNTTPLPLEGTRQLGDPLMHDVLAAELLELADTRTRQVPVVLAVDDNPSNLKLLVLHLQELGVSVETADTGATALALASRHEFSLLILDMHLPDTSGLDLAAAIRAGGLHDLPVVVLTAHISEEEKRRALDAGVHQVLIKPATRSTLAELLASLQLITRKTLPAHRPAMTANRTTLLTIFDHGLSMKLANNRPDLADEMLDALIDSLPRERDDIKHQFETGQTEGFRATIHRLHGALQYCGLPRLKNATARLETIAANGRAQEIRLALSVFDSEVDAVLEWHDPAGNYFDTSILRGGATD